MGHWFRGNDGIELQHRKLQGVPFGERGPERHRVHVVLAGLAKTNIQPSSIPPGKERWGVMRGGGCGVVGIVVKGKGGCGSTAESG